MKIKFIKYKLATSIRHPVALFRALRLGLLRRFSSKKYAKVYLKEGRIPILVDVHDNGIGRDLMIWREREVRSTKALLPLLKPGQTVLELGANIGYYLLLEAKTIGPDGRIYAIEPAPENMDLLKKNVDLNQCGDMVQLECAAVGDKTGTATLNLVDKSNLHSIQLYEDMGGRPNVIGSVEVPIYRVDDLLQKYNVNPVDVNLVRMDIEGFEYEAFQGMSGLLQNARDLLIAIEVHPNLIINRLGHEAWESFVDQLDRNGFEIVEAVRKRPLRVGTRIKMQSVRELLNEDVELEMIFHKKESESPPD